MKKLLLSIFACFMVSVAVADSLPREADDDPMVKLSAVKTVLKTDAAKYIDIQNFVYKLKQVGEDEPADYVMSGGVVLTPFVTLSVLSYACMSSVLNIKTDIYVNEIIKTKHVDKADICYKFLIEVVRAHNADVIQSFSSGDDLTEEEKNEMKELFGVKESDVTNVKPQQTTPKTWSFTMFKPDKSTKRCEADGFYFVEKLAESPIEGFEFKDCYFESDTDRVACCRDIKYQYGSKTVDYCESYYFQKGFSGDCIVGPVMLKDYFEGDVNEWTTNDFINSI